MSKKTGYLKWQPVRWFSPLFKRIANPTELRASKSKSHSKGNARSVGLGHSVFVYVKQAVTVTAI